MASEDEARNRYFAMQGLRILGVAVVVLGILMARGRIAAPPLLGYVLIGVGLLDVFAVPLLLARRWRTPPE